MLVKYPATEEGQMVGWFDLDDMSNIKVNRVKNKYVTNRYTIEVKSFNGSEFIILVNNLSCPKIAEEIMDTLTVVHQEDNLDKLIMSERPKDDEEILKFLTAYTNEFVTKCEKGLVK